MYTPPRLWALVMTALLAVGSAARADLVIFKDGFLLQGKVTREGETITDPASGYQLTVAKGSFFIVDGARRIVFSFSQVQDVDDKDPGRNADLVQLGMRTIRLSALPMYPLLQFHGTTPFNEKWEREFTYSTTVGGKPRQFPILQRVTQLNPQVARIDALRYNWSAYYQTSELGAEAVRKLLTSHPDLKDTSSIPDPMRRYRVARFFVQAGWYDEAERELDSLVAALPEEKEKVTTLRTHIKGLRILQDVEEIERGHRAGRHRWTQQQLAKFPRADAEERLVTRIAELAVKYEKGEELLKLARQYLKDLPGRVPVQGELFVEAGEAILGELGLENVGRLEAFLSLTQQAERDRAQGKPSTHGPAQLLALAVSGWLLGKDSADTKVEVAQRLWRARRFVLDYQKTPDETDRETLLAAYQKSPGNAVAIDELAQMLQYLPPPVPEKNLDVEPREFQAESPEGRKRPVNYLVQLPPEYHHGRAYPVLFALRHAGEKPSAMLDRCGKHAAKHGYILVAPAWGGELAEGFRSTPEEHAAVVNVLRDLQRRFHVDNDRVFLLGFGEGASMAFDVGLSHPDLFAGVLPMSGWTRTFSSRYVHNGQYLPFYVVNGDLTGDIAKRNREYLEKWVTWGYPALNIEYRGRGLEWFEAELPAMFDWMNRKKRATGFPDLGKAGGGGPFGQEFQTMRTTDNRFYWLSTTGIREVHLNDHLGWKKEVTGALLQGRIGEGNQISVNVKGLRQVTVWLGRDAQGRDMIDFSKPISVRVNSSLVLNNKRVQPSMSTLLEDFYLRGDRKRVFLAKESFEWK